MGDKFFEFRAGMYNPGHAKVDRNTSPARVELWPTTLSVDVKVIEASDASFNTLTDEELLRLAISQAIASNFLPNNSKLTLNLPAWTGELKAISR